tara:strand:+ start:488 stop:895 length:408 start_codon:yes stop_codon:yes gene_type:complete
MLVETIEKDGERFAFIIRGNSKIQGKEFPSKDEDLIQVGFMDLKKGETIAPHFHKFYERKIERTSEAIYILKGKIKVNIYKDKNKLMDTIIEKGDLIVLLSGGHGFEILEDTKFFEVKQGPFIGTENDKERFEEK